MRVHVTESNNEPSEVFKVFILHLQTLTELTKRHIYRSQDTDIIADCEQSGSCSV